MFKVGLTGGIGSGKSTVAKLFSCMGIPVLNADDLSRKIMQSDPAIIAALTHIFGSNVYTQGKLNRKYLAEIVFADPYQLSVLNAIVHPATFKAAEEWTLKQHTAYTIKEAALFFESGSSEGMDFIIGVTAPQSVRINRVIKRDGLTKSEVLMRMNQQIEDSLKMKLCNVVIENIEQKLLIPQVLKIHQQILDLLN